ncbi:uncharacterized protein L203_104938 [Cryptococcus depauperatus CBS 7841]|uniref:DUF1308 domain-containing protein n=1 Tax=Cryptococcus depauperatus CBS 7841 TaxID=1295531 RepID=A0AAJ8JWF4_9TREE
MDQIHSLKHQITSLLESVDDFASKYAELATYNAPIIDWHHSGDYRQTVIRGLKRFRSSVEKEKDYLQAIASTHVPPRDLPTNAPHLLAVWEEVTRAEWPIGCISQVLECPDGTQVKVDVVAKGGDEWIKVNTIKESRLMAEFREQDAYCNFDYSDGEEASDQGFGRDQLTNSPIEQVALLMKSAQSYRRLPHLPTPKVKYVLNRMEENPEKGYPDPRIKKTLDAIRSLGAELVLASDIRQTPSHIRPPPTEPTTRILLDLSVVVALCCDSTHFALPKSSEELEARFRPLQLDQDGQITLAPHIPVTKDLCAQLQWETQHPLIQEIQERLSSFGASPEFWVTEEVKNRLPKIAEIIGGEDEQRRARAMFTGEEDFWAGSRWKGREGVLRNMRVEVIAADGWEKIDLQELSQSPFRQGFANVCEIMLAIVEKQASACTLPTPPPPPKTNKSTSHRPARQPQPGVTLASRLPSAHTLRTFLAGLKHGMTVLTNNRGAVGKVTREMGISEGIAYGREDAKGKAVVWVVNPSSLSEWRRREVEKKNQVFLEANGDHPLCSSFDSGPGLSLVTRPQAITSSTHPVPRLELSDSGTTETEKSCRSEISTNVPALSFPPPQRTPPILPNLHASHPAVGPNQQHPSTANT